MKPVAMVGAVIVVVIIIGVVAYALSRPSSSVQSTVPATSAASTAGYSTVPVTTSANHTTTASTTSIATTVNATHASSKHAYNFSAGYNATYGYYLANASGYTVYLFTADKQNGTTSACTGTCTTFWPPVLVSANYTLGVPSEANITKFSTITLSDGSKQLTYDGWPLYYYAGDKSSGAITGEGISAFGGTWYLVTLPKAKVPA